MLDALRAYYCQSASYLNSCMGASRSSELKVKSCEDRLARPKPRPNMPRPIIGGPTPKLGTQSKRFHMPSNSRNNTPMTSVVDYKVQKMMAMSIEGAKRNCVDRESNPGLEHALSPKG